MCGMMTSMCVDASARAAADLGFSTSIAADACAAPNLPSGGEVIPGETVHKAFLAALGSMVADVRPTSELLGGQPAADVPRDVEPRRRGIRAAPDPVV